MNATLEQMARALFRSWFVDFDPVRAKAEGRQPAGMDAATAVLFPDGFEETELGEIPSGWEIRPLPAVLEINPPRRLAKGQIAPYAERANLPTNGARITDTASCPSCSLARSACAKPSARWKRRYEDAAVQRWCALAGTLQVL